MNVTDWNAIADAYFDMDDPQGRAVLAFIREKLATLQPKRLLDYGGGDGKFAATGNHYIRPGATDDISRAVCMCEFQTNSRDRRDTRN